MPPLNGVYRAELVNILEIMLLISPLIIPLLFCIAGLAMAVFYILKFVWLTFRKSIFKGSLLCLLLFMLIGYAWSDLRAGPKPAPNMNNQEVIDTD